VRELLQRLGGLGREGVRSAHPANQDVARTKQGEKYEECREASDPVEGRVQAQGYGVHDVEDDSRPDAGKWQVPECVGADEKRQNDKQQEARTGKCHSVGGV
jgi:hypothetical protein